MAKVKYKYPYKPRRCASGAIKELKLKHKLGVTLAPIDVCWRRGTITKDMYQAANYFIYLYSKRFGSIHLKNQVSYIYECEKYKFARKDDVEIEDNKLYKQIIGLLQEAGCYKLILDTCVYEKFPEFLKTSGKSSMHKYKDFQALRTGLECLADFFRKR